MYLSNTELITLLPEMNFSVADARYPFESDKQIQLCSIDLRISNIFWRQKRIYRAIDLGEHNSYELAPRREWKRIEIDFSETINLKPGELLLARTYESFKIPKSYAGKIVAKSSFARLGISIFCSTDFINPGWYGHCPMVIKNHGIHTIKIHPLLHMCQIIVIKLNPVPDGEFGIGKYFSSYQNDDGGPSFWWRDQVFRAIKSDYEEISKSTINELIKKVQTIDDEGLNRFKIFLKSYKTRKIGNSAEILSAFTKEEKKKMKHQKFLKGVFGLIQSVLLAQSVRMIFDITHNYSHYLFWGITIICLPITIWFVFLRDDKEYYNNI